jgi:type II secretion system protein H
LGFSLLELVVVLVIMGLAAAVVIPSFISGWSGLQLETAARDLVTEMKVARTQAISRQKVFRFRLSQDLDSTKSVAAALANEFGEPIKVFPIDSSIRLVTDQDSLLLEISFYPNGRSSGASFQLRNQAGKTIALEVDAITGFARVSKPKTES